MTDIQDPIESFIAARVPVDCVMKSAEISDRTAMLFDAEKSYIKNALAPRCNEYSTGRWLAHELLKRIDRPPEPVLQGDMGNPVWPKGVVGSISHSANQCIAVLTSAPGIRGIGVDLEFEWLQDRDAAALVMTANEASWHRTPELERLIFSAKESFFKAVFELHGDYIEHQQVEILLDQDARRFHVTTDVVAPECLSGLTGIYYSDESLALTVCTLGAENSETRPAQTT